MSILAIIGVIIAIAIACLLFRAAMIALTNSGVVIPGWMSAVAWLLFLALCLLALAYLIGAPVPFFRW